MRLELTNHLSAATDALQAVDQHLQAQSEEYGPTACLADAIDELVAAQREIVAAQRLLATG